MHACAALRALPELLAQGAGPFDLTFVNADKRNNPAYLDWSSKLSKADSVIVADNVRARRRDPRPRRQRRQAGRRRDTRRTPLL